MLLAPFIFTLRNCKTVTTSQCCLTEGRVILNLHWCSYNTALLVKLHCNFVPALKIMNTRHQKLSTKSLKTATDIRLLKLCFLAFLFITVEVYPVRISVCIGDAFNEEVLNDVKCTAPFMSFPFIAQMLFSHQSAISHIVIGNFQTISSKRSVDGTVKASIVTSLCFKDDSNLLIFFCNMRLMLQKPQPKCKSVSRNLVNFAKYNGPLVMKSWNTSRNHGQIQ